MGGIPGRRGREADADLDRWVADARSGDTDAFGRIWTALSGRVAGYLRGRGVDSPDDLTSEVFLAAFTGLSRFDGDGARFRSWLFTIAHHKAVDELRRRRPEAEYASEDDPRTSPSAELDALGSTVDVDVRRMLADLTDDQREVLLLRTLGDLSVEQVAAATGRTVGAVKQLHHRAVAAAQRSLAAPGVDGLPGERRLGAGAAASPPSPASSLAVVVPASVRLGPASGPPAHLDTVVASPEADPLGDTATPFGGDGPHAVTSPTPPAMTET